MMGQILYNRGLANGSLMRFEQAIADQYSAIEAIGGNNNAYKHRFQLGILLRRLANHGVSSQREKDDRIDQSINELRKAVELCPDEAPAHNNLGLSYFENDLFIDALGSYTSAIQKE